MVIRKEMSMTFMPTTSVQETGNDDSDEENDKKKKKKHKKLEIKRRR